MNGMQELMNQRILKEIEDLREEQTKLQDIVTELVKIVLGKSNKECYEKDK